MAQLDSRVSLKQLRYFVSVVEHHGFSAAARVLHVAQPSLSRQIALLEAALDEQLFVRHAEGTATTDAGVRLYGLARSVIERVNGAQAEVRGQERTPEGKVSIVLPAIGGNDLVVEVVQACKTELPLVELQVVDGLSTQNGQLLASGLVDFGVVPNGEEIPGLNYEPLFTEHLFLVRNHPRGKQGAGEEISFADASAVPLVLGPRDTHMRTYLEHMAGSLGLTLNVVHEQQTVGVIAAFVRGGLAGTVSNWPSICDLIPPKTALIQRVVAPPLGRQVAIGYPSARPMNHAASAAYRIVRRLVLARLHSGQWRGEPL